MEKQTYVIRFDDISGEILSRYISELRSALLEAARDIEVNQKRIDPRALDFGNTLVLILGTPAIVAATKAIGDWLKLRYNASLTIEKDGRIIAEHLTSKDAFKLAELFLTKE